MFPDWKHGDVMLYCMDCMDVLPNLPDDLVVITDVPYGIGENNQHNLSRGKLAVCTDYGDYDWDYQRLPEENIKALLRFQNQVIFGGHYYTDILPVSTGWIVWDKVNGNNDFADCELAWTSYSRAVRKIEWMWNGMLRRDREKRFHPTQKPMGVMRWIVENYSEPGDFILDPYMGAGTTGVAAVQMGRGFIGVDINRQYYDIAVTRIKEAQMQLSFDL